MSKKSMLVSCLVVVIGSVFLTSLASSQCAWVLWVKTEYLKTNGVENHFWEIVDAYPDRDQCLQASVKVWQAKKKNAYESKKDGLISEVKEVPGLMILKRFRDPKEIMSVAQSLYCFPDTLDPRGPK